MAQTEPKCIEVTVSTSIGGKVGQIKYDLSGTYQVTQTRKYSIPEDWTEDQAQEFQTLKTNELINDVSAIAQLEHDALIESSHLFQDGEYVG